MAVRKNRGKGRQKNEEKQTAPGKIQLPAFGLAEEILGNAELTAQSPTGEPRAADAGPRAAVPGPENAGGELHLVTFRIDREEYGVEIGSVQEIIRVGQITSVPNAPEFIKGVINLRGRVIPVLNLRRRLDLPDGTLTKHSRIMVVESGAKVLGMLVDGVSQVLRLPIASVDEPPGEVEQAKAYVRGIGKVDSRLIMIMDLSKALAKAAAETATRST